MAASECLGGSAERVLPLAVSIELLHSAGLIMDDLQEQRTRRRGLASMHLVYGKGTSVNLGNYMSFLPLHILANTTFPQSTRHRFLSATIEENTKLGVGQCLHIEWAKRPELPSVEEYLFMMQHRSATHARLAMKLAAYAHAASQTTTHQLVAYAEHIATACQLMDDLCNLTTQSEDRAYLGEDITLGQRSAILIRAVAQSANRSRLVEILNSKTSDLALVEEALDIISRTDALEWTKQLARDYVERALRCVEDLSNGGVLKEFAEKVTSVRSVP